MPHADIRIHSTYSYTVLQAPVYSFQWEIQICNQFCSGSCRKTFMEVQSEYTNTAHTNVRLYQFITYSFSFIGQYPKYISMTTVLSPVRHLLRLFYIW
jgi:hypothetical protein